MFIAPSVTLNAIPHTLKNGVAGIFQTIELMRELVNEFRVNQDIRNAAISTIFLQPEKDTNAEIECLFNYVRDCIRYTRDINNVETITTPDKILHSKIGDCDDKSLLLAAMCEAVGYQTRFVVAGYNHPETLEHVYCQVLSDNGWVDCDTTEPHNLGYAPPDAVILYVENI